MSSCRSCRFVRFEPRDPECLTVYECRRYPPQVHVLVSEEYDRDSETRRVESDIRHDFPSVSPDDWCGEFQPKPLF